MSRSLRSLANYYIHSCCVLYCPAPRDYTALSATLKIVAGMMQSCVNISIVDDETFSVTMATTNDRLVLIDDMAEVTILSDPSDGE